MKKINVLLFAIALLAIGCSGDNPAGPSVGKKGIYTAKFYTVPYDEQAESWDEAKKEYERAVKFNGDISIRRAEYDIYYGKNWNKGRFDENMGALIGVYDKDGDSTVYTYDSNNYLIEKINYSGGVVDNRVVYTNENGKVMSRTSTGDIYKPVSNYEYGENGYIKNEFDGDPNDPNTSRTEYLHDENGYLIERWFYSSQSDPKPFKTKYIYNNLGLLIRTEEDGEVIAELKYNSLGLVTDITNSDRVRQYKYNSNGMPIELTTYRDGKPTSNKTIVEYD